MSDNELTKETQSQSLENCYQYITEFSQVLKTLSSEPLSSVQNLHKGCHALKECFQSMGCVNFAEYVYKIEKNLLDIEATIKRSSSISNEDIGVLEFLITTIFNSLEFEINQSIEFFQQNGGVNDKPDMNRQDSEIKLLLAWQSEQSKDQLAIKTSDIVEQKQVEQKCEISKTREGLYLLCKNTRKHFAISIDNVVEIVRSQRLAPIPTPNHQLRGLLNLRGEVMPILDLQATLDVENPKATVEVAPYIVIARVENYNFGFEIEEVHEVVLLKQESFQTLNDEDLVTNSKLIADVSLTDNKVILVLDLHKALVAA